MQIRKAKILMILALALFLFFFSNDFGLIDVEKTSIITAVAIDASDDGGFEVTAQIAVPEATDANTENQKAQLSGKGSTIGGALKDLGDVSGWFPKLAFCNLILIGNNLPYKNVITAIDYFAKTLRVQDSALVAMAENSARELLETTTPLDNISSFALQKIMLKNTGFDRDVIATDVKTFCADHYSIGGSALMPLIKILPVQSGSSSSGSGESSSLSGMQSGSGGGGQKNNQKLFDARSTALFLHGVKVGELDEDLTLTLNALSTQISGTGVAVNNVPDENGNTSDYLLTVIRSNPKLCLKADDNQLTLNINLKLYCKISDHAADNSDDALSQNKPLPQNLISATERLMRKNIDELIATTKQTGCDFLKIKEKLYRHNHKQYSKYKDNYLSNLKTEVFVSIFGQS